MTKPSRNTAAAARSARRGRLAEVLLHRRDHSRAGVIGIATREERGPYSAEDADGAAPSMPHMAPESVSV